MAGAHLALQLAGEDTSRPGAVELVADTIRQRVTTAFNDAADEDDLLRRWGVDDLVWPDET